MISALPKISGISLKPQHYNLILESNPDAGWFEVHPENYMGNGGAPHKYLIEISDKYPISMHGVGMSLGSATEIDQTHLKALCSLVDRYQPQQVSEHLSWNRLGKTYFNDLLPLPYNQESLNIVTRNIDIVQSALKRKILIENPSTYLAFNNDEYSEPEYLNELVKTSGCGLLLDVNNIYVSACNQGFNAHEYLARVEASSIGEIHLAGHAVQLENGEEIRIDDHGSKVIDEVWKLYKSAICMAGRHVPTLIEWDTNIPELFVLITEMEKANTIMNQAVDSARSTAAA